jgi:5-amino-6-(5-phosphoribosylamino)uracil reductase
VNGWREQFARLVERKTRAAQQSHLAPYVTTFDRHDERALAVGNEWTSRLFDGPFYLGPATDPRRPACSLVFVQSSDGNTGARNPAALGGGDTDKHLVYEGLSRVAADAVLAGAETVRGGGLVLSVWHQELIALRKSLNKPRHPTQVVATLQGLDLDGGLMFNVPEVPVLIVTVTSAVASMRESLTVRPWIDLVVMKHSGELPQAFEELRQRGIERISAIGGRHFATQLIDGQLVGDIYLTTAPRPGGEPDTPMYPKPLHGTVLLRKHGTQNEAGVVFEHVRLI